MDKFSILHSEVLPYKKGQVVFSEYYGYLLVANVDGGDVTYKQLSRNKYVRKVQLFLIKKKYSSANK